MRGICNIKVLVILLTFIFSLFTVNARSNEAAANDSIVFETLEYDYGTIQKGSEGICEFVFTNKGESPLIVNNVRASCGCTVPQWTREPVAPGEKGVIKVKYNTNITGAFNKSVIVISNAVNRTVALVIKGKVEK
jgi:hypothetical protein